MAVTPREIEIKGELEVLTELVHKAIRETMEADEPILSRGVAKRLYGKVRIVTGPKDGSGGGSPGVSLKEDLDRA